jgi:serine/threonine-protein kinase
VKHVSERPRPIRSLRPEVPKYLAVAIDRALSKKPEDRFADAAEFRDALDGATKASHAKRLSQSALPPVPPPAVIPPMPAPPVAQTPAPFPAPPPGLSRRELREWYRAQRRIALHGHQVGVVVGNTVYPYGGFDSRPLEERVISFRRSVVGWLVWSTALFGINAAMGGVPWFFFPSALMFMNVLRKGGSIWSDGVGPFEAFRKGIRAKIRAEHGPAALVPGGSSAPLVPVRTTEELAAELAPPDVLAGAHGDAVRHAAADRAMMLGIVEALRPLERDMIPDIRPTVDALAQRVGSVATTLHRLDADVSGASLGSLDERIAGLTTEPATAERERRLSLLQRQRTSLHELLERRRSLANQLESAGLMLQNLKLDLLKFRSSGIGSAIEDQTTATQEARALSREIGLLVEASDDLKKL